MADGKLNETYKDWLQLADQDFGFASASLVEELGYLGLICFHFQQAAEKYLKAYIVAHGLDFKKIHELPSLLQVCMNHDKEFGSLAQLCEFLTEFYVEARYPALLPDQYTKELAREAQEKAREVKNFVEKKLDLNSF